MLKPNLFIPGFAKSGTSSLHAMLVEHPDIEGGKRKEPQTYSKSYIYNRRFNFFSKWSFKHLYDSKSDGRYIVDASTSYSVYPKALMRIKDETPGAKFIVIARDPIERIISHFNWMVALEKVDKTFKSEIIEEGTKEFDPDQHYDGKYKNYLWFSLYGKHLKSLYEIFDRESVLFIKFEQLINCPKTELNKIWSFLNIAELSIELPHRNKTSKFKKDDFSAKTYSTIRNKVRNWIWGIPEPLRVNNPIESYIEKKDLNESFILGLLYEDLQQLNTLGVDLDHWSTTQEFMNEYSAINKTRI